MEKWYNIQIKNVHGRIAIFYKNDNDGKDFIKFSDLHNTFNTFNVNFWGA